MTKTKKDIKTELEIPEGIDVAVNHSIIKVKGKAGEVSRSLFNPMIKTIKDGNKVVVKSLRSSKRELKIVNSFIAHIKNMFRSASEGSRYVLKICSGHFPMNVSMKGNEFIVKNFFGEKIPRVMQIKSGANVKIEGDLVTVESADKELTSQIAADIEKLTRRTTYDMRVFQDGIWIIEKDGKKVK